MNVPTLRLRRRMILLTSAVLFLCHSLTAQVRISGTVKDPSGAPLPGVSVQLEGNRIGTASDATGQYFLNGNIKPGSYSLVFSAIGFIERRVNLRIGNESQYTQDIQLETNASKLNEVIVTGTSAGTTRKQLGSFVSTVSGSDLAKSASGDVLASLQGKTAGAQITQNSGDPAGGISVRLRGTSTVNGSTEPLYIIDGVIIDNSTSQVTNADESYSASSGSGVVGQNRAVDLNPEDIDHIEVLNGAAAAAIYGSRANAGVIQIFTKRGSSGAPVVRFSSTETYNRLRKKLDVNEAPVKFGGSPDLQTQTLLNTALTNTTPVQRYDYQDYIFRPAFGTNNTVSVSGGQDKTKYYTSASYFYNQGIVRNTDFNRFSYRANLDQVLSNWASFSVNLNYIYSTSNEKPDGNTFFSPTNSVTILGNYYNIRERDSLGNIKPVGERGRVNPVSIIEDFKQQQKTSRIIAGFALKLKPFKHFTLDYNMGIDNYNQSGTTFLPAYAYNVNPVFYGGGPSLDPTQNGYASTGNYRNFQINNELNATYNWRISSNLESVTQVGYSLQYLQNAYTLQQGRGLAPFVQSVNGPSTVLPGSDVRNEISISGEYIQQNFKYKNQFFVTAAIRVDGSSIFGPDQRNQVYPKVSGSYVISESDFFKRLNVSAWWNLFKLRAAYGESGNLTGITAYQRFQNYSATNFLGRTVLSSGSSLADINVGPEKQKELEVGTDLSFVNDRIGIQFNYYHKVVDRLLLDRLIAPSNGFSDLTDNIGSLQNTGFEVVLNVVPVQTADFNWSVTGIFNHNRNKAIDIGNNSLILLNTNSGAPVAIISGQPIGVFYGTFFASDASGNQVKNASGIPQIEKGVQESTLGYTPQRDPSTGLPTGTALQKVIGNPNPKYTATLTNDFTYKKFQLHVQLDAVQGVDVFNADFRTRQGVDNGKVAEQEDLGQLPRGYVAGLYPIQQWRIDDGSFVKLRELSLSYSVGKLAAFRDLVLSVGGRNLVSWDHYKGYDPEVNAAGQSTVQRSVDFGAVPIPRTISFSVRATF